MDRIADGDPTLGITSKVHNLVSQLISSESARIPQSLLTGFTGLKPGEFNSVGI
jgi:hypothetical protein